MDELELLVNENGNFQYLHCPLFKGHELPRLWMQNKLKNHEPDVRN